MVRFVLIWLFLRETKGKTLEELDHVFEVPMGVFSQGDGGGGRAFRECVWGEELEGEGKGKERGRKKKGRRGMVNRWRWLCRGCWSWRGGHSDFYPFVPDFLSMIFPSCYLPL